MKSRIQERHKGIKNVRNKFYFYSYLAFKRIRLFRAIITYPTVLFSLHLFCIFYYAYHMRTSITIFAVFIANAATSSRRLCPRPRLAPCVLCATPLRAKRAKRWSLVSSVKIQVRCLYKHMCIAYILLLLYKIYSIDIFPVFYYYCLLFLPLCLPFSLPFSLTVFHSNMHAHTYTYIPTHKHVYRRPPDVS